LPDGERATVMPGVPTFGEPWGGTERLSFWNRKLDATVHLDWDKAVSPTPPGYARVESWLGEDGLARLSPRPKWLAAQRGDPRIQFPGTAVAVSPVSSYALYRTARTDRALWTSAGLEPDGAVLAGQPVTMTLDRRAASGARAVVVTLRGPDGATSPVRWRLTREGRTVAAGRLRTGRSRPVRVSIPACRPGACSPVQWTLRGAGPAVGMPLPAYGPPGPARPVTLNVVSAHIGGG
jgi:hypothetical protein